MVFDANLSTTSLKVKNSGSSDFYTYIDFGYTISEVEAEYYSFSFKAVTSEGAIYKESRTSTSGVEKCPIYYNIAYKNAEGKVKTVGSQKKVELKHETEWQSFSFNFVDLFKDETPVDVTGIQIWITRFVDEGAVYWDDFHVEQRSNRPTNNRLFKIDISDVAKTEYNIGEDFAFDGKVTATYSDLSTKVIANDDPNLTIDAPSTSTSGENKKVTITYVEDGVTRRASYTINVTGTNPKAEETLDIVADADDLANVSHRMNPESDTYMGCAKATNETEVTYGASANALRIAGPTNEDYCHVTIVLPSTITSSKIMVRFFAKDLPDTLICKLYNEAENKKAQYSEELTTADCSTSQEKPNKFTATDAGNGWTLYEHEYYAGNVDDGIKYLRILFRHTMNANQSGVIDGIEVKAVA